MSSFIRLSPFLTQYMMGTLDATSKLTKNRYEKVFFVSREAMVSVAYG